MAGIALNVFTLEPIMTNPCTTPGSNSGDTPTRITATESRGGRSKEPATNLDNPIAFVRSHLEDWRYPFGLAAPLLQQLQIFSELPPLELIEALCASAGRVPSGEGMLGQLRCVQAMLSDIRSWGFFFSECCERGDEGERSTWGAIENAVEALQNRIFSSPEVHARLDESHPSDDQERHEFRKLQNSFQAMGGTSSQVSSAAAELAAVRVESESAARLYMARYRTLAATTTIEVSPQEQSALQHFSPEERAAAFNPEQGNYRFPALSYLHWLDRPMDGAVLERAYRALMTLRSDTELTAHALAVIDARHREARLCGFSSYAEYQWARNGNLCTDYPATMRVLTAALSAECAACRAEFSWCTGERGEAPPWDVDRQVRSDLRLRAKDSANMAPSSARELLDQALHALCDELEVSFEYLQVEGLPDDEVVVRIVDRKGGEIGQLLVDLYAEKPLGGARCSLLNRCSGGVTRRIGVGFSTPRSGLTVDSCWVPYHELGHAMSFLLGGGEKEISGGAGAPRDAIELASFYAQYALPYEISGLADRFAGAKQAAYAIFDSMVYGPTPPRSATDLWREVDETVGSIYGNRAIRQVGGALGPLFVLTRSMQSPLTAGNYLTYSIGLQLASTAREEVIAARLTGAQLYRAVSGSIGGLDFLGQLLAKSLSSNV